MAECRHLAKELRQDVLARDEQLDRLDSRGRGGLDEILALDREQARSLAVLTRREKLPDEPELLVLARLDQVLRRLERPSRARLSRARRRR